MMTQGKLMDDWVVGDKRRDQTDFLTLKMLSFSGQVESF